MHVVFVMPFAMASSLRFARAVAELPEVEVSLISQTERSALPAELAKRIAGFERVADALAPDRLVGAVRRLAQQHGEVVRLVGILEQLQEPLGKVREELQIRGMDSREAANFRDKARMKEVLRAHGIDTAKHRLCATAREAEEFARTIGYPLVAKPPAGAGAKSTSRCTTAAELGRFLAATRPRPGQEVLIEEFVKGREYSFDSITLHGMHVFHSVSSYHPTPLTVMDNPWIQWCVVLPRDISGPEYADIHRFGPAALSALGMYTGMTHMEWFRREDGSIAIGEVAARPPGAQFVSLMSHAYDRDMYSAFAELMVHERFDPPARRYAVGAVYLRGQSVRESGGSSEAGGRVTAVHGVEEIRREFGPLIVESRLPEVGQVRSSSYEGEGFVIVRHPDTAVVHAAADRILNRMRVEIGSE
ncbi:MAG: ATP-grasp domain-containing protein [bacterium]|nr:ATP-grasp domain-containing protein [bacterium]